MNYRQWPAADRNSISMKRMTIYTTRLPIYRKLIQKGCGELQRLKSVAYKSHEFDGWRGCSIISMMMTNVQWPLISSLQQEQTTELFESIQTVFLETLSFE